MHDGSRPQIVDLSGGCHYAWRPHRSESIDSAKPGQSAETKVDWYLADLPIRRSRIVGPDGDLIDPPHCRRESIEAVTLVLQCARHLVFPFELRQSAETESRQGDGMSQQVDFDVAEEGWIRRDAAHHAHDETVRQDGKEGTGHDIGARP